VWLRPCSCLEIFTGSGEVLSTRIYRGVIARNNGDTGIKFFALDGKTTVKRVAAYDMARWGAPVLVSSWVVRDFCDLLRAGDFV